MPHFLYPFSCPWTLNVVYVLAVVNNDAMNMMVELSLQDSELIPFG